MVGNFLRWLFTEIVFLVFNWNDYAYTYAPTDYDDITTVPPAFFDETENGSAPGDINTEPSENEDPEGEFSCDHSITLYILEQLYFLTNTGVPRTIDREHENCSVRCTPKFWASYVAQTNLLLVMVEKDGGNYEGCEIAPSTQPIPTESSTNSSEPCHKLDLGALERRRLEGCFTYNEKEKDIKECGIASTTQVNVLLFLSATIMTLIAAILS